LYKKTKKNQTLNKANSVNIETRKYKTQKTYQNTHTKQTNNGRMVLIYTKVNSKSINRSYQQQM